MRVEVDGVALSGQPCIGMARSEVVLGSACEPCARLS
jgi:hypothetical protein